MRRPRHRASSSDKLGDADDGQYRFLSRNKVTNGKKKEKKKINGWKEKMKNEKGVVGQPERVLRVGLNAHVTLSEYTRRTAKVIQIMPVNFLIRIISM